jgi:hypothetical protein
MPQGEMMKAMLSRVGLNELLGRGGLLTADSRRISNHHLSSPIHVN